MKVLANAGLLLNLVGGTSSVNKYDCYKVWVLTWIHIGLVVLSYLFYCIQHLSLFVYIVSICLLIWPQVVEIVVILIVLDEFGSHSVSKYLTEVCIIQVSHVLLV